MSQAKRFFIFWAVFLFLNLFFIPLLAAYGLTVCPILRVAGFSLGCSYSGLFVGLVFGINFFITHRLLKFSQRQYAKFIYPFGYLLSTLLALIFLQNIWGFSHSGAQSRAPQILLLSSLLLGITQFYGLSWAKREGVAPLQNLGVLWRSHSLRVMLPIFAGLLVLIHFATSLKGLSGEAFVTIDSLIIDVLLIVFFLSVWLTVTYGFHFLAEKDSVDALTAQLNLIEDGKYAEAVPFKTWGLWQFLSHRLAALAQTMKERNSLLKSFSRFVAKDVAQRATEQEITHVEGAKIELTIIMIDIREFTKISESLNAEKIILMLNAYFDMVIDVFVENSIHIDKFIGDGILAYVEPSDSREKDNSIALIAMEKIFQRLDRLNLELAKEAIPTIGIGAGIHRGEVVRGLIGSHRRLEHTIIGDPVNRTARLESLTKDYGVRLVVSDQVYDFCSSEQKRLLRALGLANIKGILEPIRIFGW